MKRLVQFQALGLGVVPWSVPTIGTATTKTGKRVRFTTRPKKSRLAEGKASLEDWQKFVAAAARRAWGDREPLSGLLRLHFDFYARTPIGRRHGEIWGVEVAFNPTIGEWTKRSISGVQDPDLTNMVKGTEDAIQNVFYYNDVQVRCSSASAWFGPQEGVRVTIHAIEPGDFPGEGDPVE